ncbi:MAG: hypothetical protein MJE77_33860 [Proteobacteria bacterium]|nr:hypothetical protein [Pseudomonadota bacterium]
MGAAIAARYGLPAAELAHRLASGRFRVKSGIDRDTATRLIIDLESLGAVCSLEDETGRLIPPARSAPAPQPPSRPGQGSPARESGPPYGGAASPSEYQSGLAAATESTSAQPDLGALDQGAGDLALATLDGKDDQLAPGQEAVASFDAAAFAPPQAGEAGELRLAIDPAQARRDSSRRLASQQPDDGLGPVVTGVAIPPGLEETNLPPPSDGGAVRISSELPAQAPRPHSQSMDAVAPEEGARAASMAGGTARASRFAAGRALIGRGLNILAGVPRARYATGVFLALLLGFLPAHIFASVREGSVFDEIDAQVQADQERIVDIDDWNALDGMRQAQLDRKESAQFNIALGGIFIWLLAGAGVSFLWFRKIDWDAYRSPG